MFSVGEGREGGAEGRRRGVSSPRWVEKFPGVRKVQVVPTIRPQPGLYSL
jgi:hypothetical protein